MKHRLPMGRLERSCAWLLAAAMVVAAAPSRAAEPTAEDRERARGLVFDGREKLKAGDVEGAVRSFQAAHAIMGVPTTGLDLAKGLVAQGKLIEARTVALEVSRMPPDAREPAAFVKARAASGKLAEELAGRIPAMVIAVKAPPGVAAQVMVDGTAVPPEALGLPWKVNPGEHVVAVAAAGFKVKRRTVSVAERESVKIELELVPEVAAPAATPTVSAAKRESARAAVAPGEAGANGGSAGEEGGKRIPTWAWVSGGAGLAAIGVGVAFAVDHASVRSTVSGDCPEDLCDWQRYELAEADALEGRWNRSLGLAIGLGAAGLVGVGAAVVGIVTAPGERPSDARKQKHRRGVAVAPWVGGEGAGATVLGRF